VSDDIRQIRSQDPEIQEEWLRETYEPGRAVNVCRVDEIGGWQVIVRVMEYVSEDPLESDLRERITAALRDVTGVTSADEHDRETWFVTGAPSGKALIEATARVLDDLAERTRPYVGPLPSAGGRGPRWSGLGDMRACLCQGGAAGDALGTMVAKLSRPGGGNAAGDGFYGGR
jgi:hypothetical protein